MGRFSVGLLTFACSMALWTAAVGDARADHKCLRINNPTTITTDRRCVEVEHTVLGDVRNQATVGRDTSERPGFFIGEGGLLTGALINDGTIRGGGGAWGALTLGEDADVEGGIINNGTIASANGDAIRLGYVETWHAYWWPVRAPNLTGDIVNNGTIAGQGHGIAALYGTMMGALINETGGTITGDVALFIADTFTSWTGGVVNRGAIAGATTGVSIETPIFAGGFVNTGTITGGTTGVHIATSTFDGGFLNDGTIQGGGANTGLFIGASVFNGDIVNNGELSAPSNALELQIATLNGQIKNRGTIEATAPGGVAVELAVGNGATFVNEQGGLILGDVHLGGAAAYTFLGRDGGVEGSIVGNWGLNASDPRDDVVRVEDGTQVFVDGALENLLSFVVGDGGTALMGAREIGDPNGPGYSSANVDHLAVNDGGRLYLNNNTILNVGDFAQEAGGELTYYLVAPAAGDPVAGEHFGRIEATGTANLGGKLSVILDPSSFGGTTETEFHYADIIKAGAFSGEFDDLEIQGSSYFFRLELTYGSSSIDLGVTRTPFDQTFCEEHISQNSDNLGAAIEAAFQAGGFTPDQIALFDFLGHLQDVCAAYFDLGGAVLGDINAITVETAGPWKSAVNDRLNSTGATSCVVAGAGGCLTRYAQNEAAGTLSDAQDPFAWLRTGVRPAGQFSVWGKLLGVQGDNQGRGTGTGSDFTVTGGIAGADYVVTQRFIVGLAAQWTNTDVDFKKRRDTADVRSLEVGGYFSYGDAAFCLNGNASIIFHDFDTYRFPFGGAARGSYDGTTLSAYLEAGKVYEFDVLRVEPVLALSFAALDTDAYGETGTLPATLLLVEGASHRSLKSALGVRVAYPLAILDSGRKIVPEARVLWAHEFLDDQAEFRAALASLPDFPFTVVGQRYSRESLLTGVGVNIPLSASSTLYADYDLAWSNDRTIQSLSVGARMSW